ncbi:hypothetical protein O6H91_18G029500 [Diphasiastrum complanatum]|uniref:Uncharacterized protein n=1 Tax=Diphasiastrum complanatum TaxID=34168 RepID=A0ACC2AZC5_DIPCM|nr:hypothetical protein O6H91_18G029500 [Diphasiastrum complanatum]
MDDLVAGFAKLQGENFEYYMQTYSILIGRNTSHQSSQDIVDLDLTKVGGGKNISRHHARIHYDFSRKRFSLDVLGSSGCCVEGVSYPQGSSSIKLDSQDLLQIGDQRFYFLLPKKQIVTTKPTFEPDDTAVVSKQKKKKRPISATKVEAPNLALGSNVGLLREELQLGVTKRARMVNDETIGRSIESTS